MVQFDESLYTNGANRAIKEARNEVLRRGRDFVAPIDLLVGLLADKQQSSAARRALDILNISADEVREKLERIERRAKRSPGSLRDHAVLPLPEGTATRFGSDSKQIFTRAAELAERDGASRIGTEHLLLALYDDQMAPLVRAILQDFGVKDGEDQKARDMHVGALAQAVASRSVEAQP